MSNDDTASGPPRKSERRRRLSGGKSTAADLRKQIEENGNINVYKEQLAIEKALDFVLSVAK